MMPPKCIAIVVGEESGDILGAGLMKELQRIYPDCRFEGIGGRRMLERGFHSLFPMERLAVMGLVEPLKRLPELLSIRKQLKQRYTTSKPDVFIGIDAPDFNLSLEEHIRCAGVKTVHYVSPSVWAWRQGRVKKIARAVDLMLTLFPFEAKFYQEHSVQVHCVGHTLADDIPLEDQKYSARDSMGLDAKSRYIALLPGSRKSEVEKLAQTLLCTAERLQHEYDGLTFLIPAANEQRHQELQQFLAGFPKLKAKLFLRHSHEVMAAADIVVMASGTTTLEAMLLKRPMVIVYRVASLTYAILSRLVKSEFVGLPNLLAGRQLVPELIQHDATVDKITEEVTRYIEDKAYTESLMQSYRDIHSMLRKNADEEAAKAIVALLEK